MILKTVLNRQDETLTHESYKVFTDDGTEVSRAEMVTRFSRYGNGYLPTLAVGGVATELLYRRKGCVRMMFDKLFAEAPGRGWAVSVLHPFSFAYYRRFGYEKVSEHKTCEFPMSAIAYVPRCADFRKMENYDILQDVLTVFERFTMGRNLSFQRFNAEPYHGKNVYVWYDQAGCPSAYIVMQGENYYSVNRMVSVNLHVYEMAYTSPEGLLALFGVMRMFEGEFDSVFLHDIAMLPEVELVLKNYMHTSCRTYSDLALRILDVEAVLKANTYPTEGGRFVLRVEDNLPYVRGVYEVVYAGGGCEVVRKPEGGAFDLSVPVTALSRLLYGTEQFDARLASYMEGVVLQNDASDFFRAFPKKINGLYEHF